MATSIGEEGLDIGDIDLIICYDTSSSPVRMASCPPCTLADSSYKEWAVQVVNGKEG